MTPAQPSPELLRKRLRILENAPEDGVIVHEVYSSLQGESSYAGLPCTFIRTSGCHLRCTYCDTAHAFSHGEPWTQAKLVEQVQALGNALVEITGGEPLLQPNVLPLMTELCERGHRVLLETSGAVDIRPVDPRVVRIVDFKAPDSGEIHANFYSNVEALHRHDEVKLVLSSRRDYEWARDLIGHRKLADRCAVLMGVVWGKLEYRELAGWILADRLPVRMQLQHHKHIWDPKARGV